MIEKISFSNPGVSQRMTNTTNFAGLEETNLPQDKGIKEKSKAAKYMIGAAALAGVIAVGIIAHKANWFSKAKAIGADLTDFSKLKGEKLTRNVEGKELYVVQQKGKDGKLIKEFISEDNKRLNKVNAFQADGEKLNYVIDYSPETGKKLKMTGYQADGKTLDSVIDYSPETGKRLKKTGYQADGKTLDSVTDYSPETGKMSKKRDFQSDGKTVKAVTKYSPETGKMSKKTDFQSDGKTVKAVTEYPPETGKAVKITRYQADGKTVKAVTEYSPVTGELYLYIKCNKM